MCVVRPFEARVVRQEWAAQAVTPMVDALGQNERPPSPASPPTAYEDSPRALYVYRMRRGEEDHVGVVADVRLDAFAGGGIRGHESVEPERVDALVRYYADLPTRSEPVALLHAHRPDTAQPRRGHLPRSPAAPLPGAGGARAHRVARRRRRGRRPTSPRPWTTGSTTSPTATIGWPRGSVPGSEPAGRPDAGVLCMLFPMDGLTMSAFHRRVSGPVDAAALLDAAAGHFEVRRVAAADATSGIGMYVAGCWYDLASRGTSVPKERPGWTPPSCRTGSSVRRWASPGRGTPGSRCSPPMSRSSSRRRGATRTAGRCSSSDAPSLRRLTRIADLGEQMPPKTTYFAPKPSAGIFLT